MEIPIRFERDDQPVLQQLEDQISIEVMEREAINVDKMEAERLGWSDGLLDRQNNSFDAYNPEFFEREDGVRATYRKAYAEAKACGE